jgi:phosphoenolpyruvate-protein phosphotransferase
MAAALRREGRGDEAEIIAAQALMAADEELLAAAESRHAAGDDAAVATVAAGEAVAAGFEALDDEVLAARAADVRDVANRIARHVAGAPPPRLDRRSIAVAVDLAPSVTVELDRELLAGIALEGGSATSHAAILARGLGIPAVVGVPDLLARAVAAEQLGIDGGSGLVVLDPDAGSRAGLERAGEAADRARAADTGLRDRPLATSDGHRLVCAANIGKPEDASTAFAAGAEAIGLFRTEFAFAGRPAAPTETQQAELYEAALRAAGDAPVVVRLADIGGDKPVPYLAIPDEPNPFLGLRGLRLHPLHPAFYPTQLRGILAASARAGRPAAIMAPMIADVDDATLLRQLVAGARAAVPDAPAPRVGIMIEIPSAVLLADELAAQVDFMSIGTNDLTQYLLAADRSNPALAARQDPLHPAVLRAIRRVVEAARAADCDVAACGEMAGEPAGAMLLVGLGVDELSMDASAFGAVKRAVGARTRGELTALAEKATRAGSASAVRALVAA